LSDFTNREVRRLSDTIIRTPFPNLFLISGADNALNLANIHYRQKMRLLKTIPKLSFDYIILDLGAGTAFNTIDFFMISDHCVFVTTPEPTSIENVYRLIRSVYFRKIRHILNENEFNLFISRLTDRTKGAKMDFLSDLVATLQHMSLDKARLLRQLLDPLEFKLVINQFRRQDNPNLGALMSILVKKHLGINMEFVGNIGFDDRVHTAICDKVPYIQKYPYTRTATELRELCSGILLIETRMQDTLSLFESIPS